MRRRAPSKRALAAMVVVVQLVAGTGWAAPAPVRLQVTGERLDPKHAKTLEPRVREGVERFLRDGHGVAIEEDATTEVRIELRPFEDPKKRDELIFRVTVSSDGTVVYSGQPTSCLQCDEAKLIVAVLTRVTEAVGHLPEQPKEAVAEEAGGDAEPAAEEEEGTGEANEAVAETTEPPVEDGPQPSAAPSLTLRNAGLGLLIPGGVALGVGIGLVAVGTREVDDGVEVDLTERNYRPPGIGLAVVGGLAVAAGIGLRVTHATRRGARERVSLSPVLERTRAGVVLRGRF